MGELKVGTIAMVYGLVKNVDDNGKCVTLLEIQDTSSGSVRVGGTIIELNEYMKDYISSSQYWWFCDDGCFYMPKNLLPIGDKDNDLVKDKEKEHEH